MTIQNIIASSPLPRPETEILLAFVLKKSREYILTHPEIKITSAYHRLFSKLVKRRQNNEPIAYLIGKKEFYGLNFQVNKNVLVPRPETELMIDLILTELNGRTNPWAIIDIGTGSGAIIITLANEIKKQLPKLGAKCNFYGTDISGAALKIARLNAQTHGLFSYNTINTQTHGLSSRNSNIAFRQGDLLKALERSSLGQSSLKDIIITANLPYLTPQQIKHSPSISAEPTLALDGGRDGLKYYRRLFKQIKKPSGDYLVAAQQIILYCEIDPSQAALIKKSIRAILPGAQTKVYQDLRKKNRLIKIIWQK